MKKILNRLLNAWSSFRALIFSQETPFDNIDINGSKEFCEKISAVLMFLKERDPQVFDVVNKNLDWIIESRTTMLSITRWGIGLCLSEGHIDGPSQAWTASLLAYQSFRAQLYKENLKKNSTVPKEAYSGKKVWELQYECLKNLGADFEELKHLADFMESCQS